MKIKPEHFEYMKAKIDKVLAKYPDLPAQYERGDFPRSDKVKDLQKRFCFDVFHGAGLTSWACENIYPYANDNHVYTALKAILPKVENKYSSQNAVKS